MADNVLEFNASAENKSSHRSLTPSLATSHPYESPSVPRDVLQYLPPNGNPFSLFGDPYAQIVYILTTRNVIRRSQYWLQQREDDNSYTTTEIALLSFLSKHRCATISQIHRAVFSGEGSRTKVRDFVKRCVDAGVLIPFTWQSPCDHQEPIDPQNPGEKKKKRPRIYGMSPAACSAAEQLLNLRGRLPRSFKFLPIDYNNGQNPLMGDIFNTVVANELYCNLFELDRVIDWSVGEKILLPNSQEFRTQFIVKLIKDANDFKVFWIEVIRPRNNWYTYTINRFQALQKAFSAMSPETRPERVIIIVDDDSRISDVAILAEEFMPDVEYRFSTDERTLQGWNDSSLVRWSGNKLSSAAVAFLRPDHKGMTASEYRESFKLREEDLFDDDDY